ncbi:sensor histidine kinase [Hymenobacter nivis]|uniref:histidine kinase n=1 Tax=Hymenobacter nivis TaxID=1850093 RepID=A0A502GQ92_9BACT|nr:ATP-binding protein [Hymenobacter nivis]TPG64507.1 hypothetical protein EAH73_15140 [Hymenobacter nivis]
MPTPLTAAELSTVTAFAGLPDDTLAWLLAHGEDRHYGPDETVVQAGDAAQYMMAVVAGGIQFYFERSGHAEPVFRIEAGQVSGVLPYSRLRTINGRGVAVGETRILLLHRDLFPELERTSPDLIQRLVGLMSDRVRDQTRSQERDEKLRALGKLSAGLAHELNNPAAAISRAAATLGARLTAQPELLSALASHCPAPEALHALTLLAHPQPAAAGAPATSALDRADQEDELADWLETQAVPDGSALASTLLAAGLGAPALAEVAALLPPAARPAAFAWLEGQLSTQGLLRDVQEASSRISTLVDNVKTYSHMDRGGDFAPLDVAAGLESTLNIFGYQLRAKNIRLTREYAPGLPQVRGQVSSLNQVWTNLIDNAVDALPPGGGLTLRTRLAPGFVQVCVADDGPGIPADVLPHIFEPFYTTKQAGEGTGLGLDIAQRIVQNHGGRLEVTSGPQGTEFCAWLPVA